MNPEGISSSSPGLAFFQPTLGGKEISRATVHVPGELRVNLDQWRALSDHTGYDFWLTKLNQFNGDYIKAEMVKAFLSSIEYRQRFGP